MERERQELTDLVVNKLGQLLEIPGIGKTLVGDAIGSPTFMLEHPVNKISDCYCFQGWCEENYYQEEDDHKNEINQEVSGLCFGFNPHYVDPYRGW